MRCQVAEQDPVSLIGRAAGGVGLGWLVHRWSGPDGQGPPRLAAAGQLYSYLLLGRARQGQAGRTGLQVVIAAPLCSGLLRRPDLLPLCLAAGSARLCSDWSPTDSDCAWLAVGAMAALGAARSRGLRDAVLYPLPFIPRLAPGTNSQLQAGVARLGSRGKRWGVLCQAVCYPVRLG